MSRFVIQAHNHPASGLHYDLRFEHGDTLESFFFRKPIPVGSGQDHMIWGQESKLHDKEWLDVSGRVEGEGTYDVVDSGQVEVLKWIPGEELKIRLHGAKYSGEYVFIPSYDGYLLFKKDTDMRNNPLSRSDYEEAIKGEGWAIGDYEAMVTEADSEVERGVLAHIAEEEKEHLEELMDLWNWKFCGGPAPEHGHGHGHPTENPRYGRYKTRPEPLRGGLGEGVPDSRFDTDQLERGTIVEMEHTVHPGIAREIAKDHLTEIPDYYTWLDEMEEEAEAKMREEEEEEDKEVGEEEDEEGQDSEKEKEKKRKKYEKKRQKYIEKVSKYSKKLEKVENELKEYRDNPRGRIRGVRSDDWFTTEDYILLGNIMVRGSVNELRDREEMMVFRKIWFNVPESVIDSVLDVPLIKAARDKRIMAQIGKAFADAYVANNARRNPRYWGDAGAGALIYSPDRGEFLMQFRNVWVQYPYTWSVWGGTIEPGEDPYEGMMSEVSEELCNEGHAEMDVETVLGPVYTYHDRVEGFKFYYYIVIVSNEPSPSFYTNAETLRTEWMSLSKLRRVALGPKAHPGLKRLFEDSYDDIVRALVDYRQSPRANPHVRIDDQDRQAWYGQIQDARGRKYGAKLVGGMRERGGDVFEIYIKSDGGGYVRWADMQGPNSPKAPLCALGKTPFVDIGRCKR